MSHKSMWSIKSMRCNGWIKNKREREKTHTHKHNSITPIPVLYAQIEDVLMISRSVRFKSSAKWPWNHAKIEQKHFNHLFWWNCVLYLTIAFWFHSNRFNDLKIVANSRSSQQWFNIMRQFKWHLNTCDTLLLRNLFWNVNSSNFANIDKNSDGCHNPMNAWLIFVVHFGVNSCSFVPFAVVFLCPQTKQKPS